MGREQLENVCIEEGEESLSARSAFSDVSNSPGNILHSANHRAHVNVSPKFKCSTIDMQLKFAKLIEI